MLNRITAAAISTVLCLTTAIPGTADCSQKQTAETYASIAASAKATNSILTADDETNTTTTTTSPAAAATTTSTTSAAAETVTTTAVIAEPTDEEPVEEGSLGVTISYRLYDDGTLFISGRGIMDNYSKSPFKTPGAITKAVVSNSEGSILTIGSSVFSNCTRMTEIDLPNTLVSIEESAFANCKALADIRFEGVASENAGELTFPESIESIKESAFLNCTQLHSVTVPETVLSVGNSAFSGCEELESAVISGNDTVLGKYIFNRCISLRDLTLPFAGFSAEVVNNGEYIAPLLHMFKDQVSDNGFDYTYPAKDNNSSTHHIPKTLESITITGGEIIPQYAFYNLSSLKSIVIPDNISAIGDSSFKNCTALTEFDIPTKLTSIGDSAFLNCEGIVVDIPEGVKSIGGSAFENCTSITEINVPAATETIGDSAFAGCSALKKAVIEGGSSKIGNYIFNRCISLSDITLPFAGFSAEAVDEENSISWLGYLFKDQVKIDDEMYTYAVKNYISSTYYIPNTLESITVTGGKNIPSYAFDGLSSLKSIVIPDDISVIGSSSFRNCKALTGFKMPSKLTSIGDGAFLNCESIVVDIPEGVKAIGDSAFENCISITEIKVPEATETIERGAFAGCSALKKAVIEGGSSKIGDYIFNRCISLSDITLPFAGFSLESVNNDDPVAWLGYLFRDNVEGKTYALRSYNGYVCYIPNTLESMTITGGKNIPSYAFDGFSSLTSITIPDEISVIGNSSFRNCKALTEFDIPSKLTSIGDSAFLNCEGIVVDIPEGVKTIGSSAFENCASITEINVPAATETIGSSAFAGCSALEKAVIEGGSSKIGDYIFSRCISLRDITLPFAGFSLESVNNDDPVAWLGYLFRDSVEDKTYGLRSYNGYICYIPNTIESMTITGGKNIPSYAFDGFSSLTSITIPDDISVIGNSSFRNCKALTEFDIPSKLTSIGDSAFLNCEGIVVDIPEGVKSIGSSAFENCASITEIHVPKATETIGSGAFAGCTALKKAVIEGGSSKIGDYIFSRCISLEDLTLPFTAFSEEAAGTENETAWLGYLFRDSVEGKTYGVRSYNGYICYIPNSLKNITFIDGEYMANNLLQGFGSIENVTLPGAIKDIGSSAFDGCKNILNVFYPDTEEAWEDVNVKEKNESIEGKIRFNATTTTTTSTSTTTKKTTSTTTTTSTTSTTTTTTPPVTEPEGKLGDPNNDGIIDAVDASYILALYATISTSSEVPTEHEWKTCDVNSDGYIDAVDASAVLAYYAHVSTDGELSFEEFIKNKEQTD